MLHLMPRAVGVAARDGRESRGISTEALRLGSQSEGFSNKGGKQS